ncbi:HEAT repeat-containing protein 4 [Cladochytrium tenue]|nr:HEAT repeat-containing protein 4 [Cladochytrium tenue]
MLVPGTANHHRAVGGAAHHDRVHPRGEGSSNGVANSAAASRLHRRHAASTGLPWQAATALPSAPCTGVVCAGGPRLHPRKPPMHAVLFPSTPMVFAVSATTEVNAASAATAPPSGAPPEAFAARRLKALRHSRPAALIGDRRSDTICSSTHRADASASAAADDELDAALESSLQLVAALRRVATGGASAASGNPLVAAIDAPHVPGTRMPLVRQPPSLPPGYRAELAALRAICKALREEENIGDVNAGLEPVYDDVLNAATGFGQRLELTFDSEATQQLATWPYTAVLNRRTGVFRPLPPPPRLALAGIEHSRRRQAEEARSLHEEKKVTIFEEIQTGLDKDESMLLLPVVEEDIPPSKKTVSFATFKLLKKFTKATMPSDRRESAKEISAGGGHQSRPNDSRQQPHSGTVEQYLKMALTGIDNPSVDTRRLGDGEDNILPIAPAGHSAGGPNSCLGATRRRRRRQYRITATGGIVAESDLWQTDKEGDFQFVLPTSDDTNAPEEADDAGEEEADSGSESSVSEDLETALGKTGHLQNAVDQDDQGLIDLSLPRPGSSLKRALLDGAFTLANFVSMVRRASRFEEPKTSSEADRILSFDDTTSPEDIQHHPIDRLGDFLSTPYTRLKSAPFPGTVAHTILHQTLALALRSPAAPRELRFEAARLLTSLCAHPRAAPLPRWHAIHLRQALEDMLAHGAPAEAFFAATQILRSSGAAARDAAAATGSTEAVDPRALVVIRAALGDVDERRRRAAVEALAGLDRACGPAVIRVCLEDARSSSWRVRADAVELLERWCVRLGIGSAVGDGATRDPPRVSIAEHVSPAPATAAASDSRAVGGKLAASEASRGKGGISRGSPLPGGRLAPPAGSSATRGKTPQPAVPSLSPSKGRALSPAPAADQVKVAETSSDAGDSEAADAASRMRSKRRADAAKERERRLQEQVERLAAEAVELLLDLMWRDWSGEVRRAATAALTRLGKSDAVLARTVDMLHAPDPTVRVEALRALENLSSVVELTGLGGFLTAFDDTYASVRLEACRVAASVIRGEDRVLINTILDRLGDHDERVRVTSLRALGRCGNPAPRISEALRWCMQHDTDGTVRAAAARAAARLGLPGLDTATRDALLVMAEMDPDRRARRDAARAVGWATSGTLQGLVLSTTTVDSAAAGAGMESAVDTGRRGVRAAPPDATIAPAPAPAPAPGTTVAAIPFGGGVWGGAQAPAPASGTPGRRRDAGDGLETAARADNAASASAAGPDMVVTTWGARSSEADVCVLEEAGSDTRPLPDVPSMGGGLLPAALQGHAPDEVALYFRGALVGEREQRAVIDHVRRLSDKALVLREVALAELAAAQRKNVSELGGMGRGLRAGRAAATDTIFGPMAATFGRGLSAANLPPLHARKGAKPPLQLPS